MTLLLRERRILRFSQRNIEPYKNINSTIYFSGGGYSSGGGGYSGGGGGYSGGGGGGKRINRRNKSDFLFESLDK